MAPSNLIGQALCCTSYEYFTWIKSDFLFASAIVQVSLLVSSQQVWSLYSHIRHSARTKVIYLVDLFFYQYNRFR